MIETNGFFFRACDSYQWWGLLSGSILILMARTVVLMQQLGSCTIGSSLETGLVEVALFQQLPVAEIRLLLIATMVIIIV